MKTFKRNTSCKVIAILMIVMTLFTSAYSALADTTAYLATAKKCKQYLVDNDFRYRKGGKTYPIDAATSTRIDCSGYVGWTIYEYLNGDFECKKSSWYLNTAKKLYAGKQVEDFCQGWKAVKGSENFRPGDILCYSGHVHIYYGIDKSAEDRFFVLNAGGNSALDTCITSIRGEYFRRAQYAIRLP